MDKGKKNTVKKKTTQTSKNDKPKIREIKDLSDDFSDFDDGEDKRLIVFISIAILVILGTIIGLIVGCEKKKEEEEEKPKDDVVIPVYEEEEIQGVETKEVVRKVKSVYKATNKTKQTNTQTTTEETEEKETVNISYYLNDDVTVIETRIGALPSEYLPDGYSACRYYSDSELNDEYNMEEEVSEDANIYMSCDLITYTIVYDEETTNPTTYTVEDNDITLVALDDENFVSWALSDGTEITIIDKSIVEYADSNNTIYLYAKYIIDGDTTDSIIPTTGSEINEEEDLVVVDEENKEENDPVIVDEENKEEDDNPIIVDEENKEENDNQIVVDEENKEEDNPIVVDEENKEEDDNLIIVDEENKEDDNLIIVDEKPIDENLIVISDDINKIDSGRRDEIIKPEEDKKEKVVDEPVSNTVIESTKTKEDIVETIDKELNE